MSYYKWHTGWGIVLVFLTFGVEHGAGVEGGKAAANSAAGGVLRPTATRVWRHCVQRHVRRYLAWGHRIRRPHGVAPRWPAPQRCSVWRTAGTINRETEAVCSLLAIFVAISTTQISGIWKQSSLESIWSQKTGRGTQFMRPVSVVKWKWKLKGHQDWGRKQVCTHFWRRPHLKISNAEVWVDKMVMLQFVCHQPWALNWLKTILKAPFRTYPLSVEFI